MMPQLSDAFGLSAMARRVDGRPLLLRLLALQSGRGRRDGPARARGRSCRSARLPSASARLLFATGDQQLASVGRFLQGAGGVFALVGAAYIATTNFPGLARRDADRRDADVRHGRRLGRAVRRRAADRVGRRLEHVLGRHGRRPASRSASCCSSCCPKRSRRSRDDDWLKSAGARCCGRLPESAVDPVRDDRRPALHPDDDLRHGLGRALPAGRRAASTTASRDALGDRSLRLDHRLPAARLRSRIGSAGASR